MFCKDIPESLPIPGYPRYRFTYDGKVIGVHGRALKMHLIHENRYSVFLYDGKGNPKNVYIHQIIRATYLSGYTGIITHKNHDPRDFAIWNIEKTTRHELHSKGCYHNTPVVCILPDGQAEFYPSMRKAAFELGLSKWTVQEYRKKHKPILGIRILSEGEYFDSNGNVRPKFLDIAG